LAAFYSKQERMTVSKLDELRAHAAAGRKRVALAPAEAEQAVHEHVQNGGRFKDHHVMQAVRRALYTADLAPDMRAKAEAKLFELLAVDPIEGVTIERGP
jgi:hypothetical protein